jgi:hypothetical protein
MITRSQRLQAPLVRFISRPCKTRGHQYPKQKNNMKHQTSKVFHSLTLKTITLIPNDDNENRHRTIKPEKT